MRVPDVWIGESATCERRQDDQFLLPNQSFGQDQRLLARRHLGLRPDRFDGR